MHEPGDATSLAEAALVAALDFSFLVADEDKTDEMASRFARLGLSGGNPHDVVWAAELHQHDQRQHGNNVRALPTQPFSMRCAA